MGHNIDLTEIYGIDNLHRCPICKHIDNQNFDEYDIDCGDPFSEMNEEGIVELDCYCDNCNNDYVYRFKVRIEELE